jgi:hypothetical protein
MKAMKWLRSCGVRNINVFIDGHYYSELMKQTTGEEMQLTPGYSLYPVFQKSIFHPKIWMLFGEKEGLLIVGSGNLTNSGNGSNDEIWGAFHFDIRSIENASIFSAAWNYVSMLSSTVRGQMNEKTTRWIIEHSKWLNELPSTNPFQFSDTSQKEKVAFLFNSETSSIWEEMARYIRNEKVTEITTISPFYDINGRAIQELTQLFPKALINIILDENGLIPSSMQVTKGIRFYDWYDIGVSKLQYSKSDNLKSKLHAKIILFRTEGGKEFCLFGSANVTPEGLGLAGKGKSNAEVSLFLQSDKGGLLNDLGIKFKQKNSRKLSDFSATSSPSIYESIIKHNQYKVHLLSAELIYDELTLHSDGNYPEQFKVIFFDKQNKGIQFQTIPKHEQELKLKLNADLTGFLYVQFADSADNFISNKLLVSDYFLLARTHPNPKTEDIERIYSEIQNGELSKVLDLLHYAIMDETEMEDGSSNLINRKTSEDKREEKKEPDKLYDLSTYKPILHSAFEKTLLLSSLSLRVLDVLKFIQSKGISTNGQIDISGDEQEDNLGSISGNELNEVKTIHYHSYTLLCAERRKLHNYFDKLYNYQQAILYGGKEPANYILTLTDLTRYLIAIELLFEYGGKTEKYDEQGNQYFFSYLPFENNYDNDNVKGSCLNLIGDFLMLARTGFKKYEFEYTKAKVEQLKNEALISTIVCLLNNYWVEKELHYLDSLLLNAMHYLGWKDAVCSDNKFNELKSGINGRITELKHRAIGLNDNIERFFFKICPAFEQVIKQLADKKFDTSATKGCLIYKSPWGYCYVQSVDLPNRYTLIRPGFLWDKETGDYLKYRPTEVYKPMELNSFILIDI